MENVCKLEFAIVLMYLAFFLSSAVACGLNHRIKTTSAKFFVYARLFDFAYMREIERQEKL